MLRFEAVTFSVQGSAAGQSWLLAYADQPERGGRDDDYGKNQGMARASTHIEKICAFVQAKCVSDHHCCQLSTMPFT